jgi:hypothetical protein
MARIGDPAWDLAGLTARLLVARGDDAPWTAADVTAAAHLVAAYRAATGLALPALAHRLVLFTGAVLLATALQYGSTVPAGADPVPARQIVRRARATLARASPLTAEVVDAAESLAPAGPDRATA